MSIFDKPVNDVVTADLAELLAESAVENVRLEFKRELPNRDEMLKKVSSFANTFGGLIVIGAEASSKDGRLISLSGVDVESGFKQRVVQWAFDGIYPPISPMISPPINTPAQNGKVCYVIRVEESEETPHFLNGRKGAYVRSDEFSQRFKPELATFQELQHLTNRRLQLVRRRRWLFHRSRKRFDAFVRLNYESSPETSGPIGATASFFLRPVYPSRPLQDHFKVDELVRRTRVKWRQENFPRLHDPVSQAESTLLLRGAWGFSLVEVNTWGQIFVGREIEESRTDENGSETRGIHLYAFVGHLLAYLEYGREMYTQLQYTGPLLLTLSLLRIRNIPFLVFPNNIPQASPSSPIDDTVRIDVRTSTEDLRQGRDEVVREVLRSLLFALNWAAQAQQPATLERLLQYGHWYAFWRSTEP
jgi:hypothetical protein